MIRLHDMAKKGPKNPLTDQHKAAMAAGRTEGKAVREYLDALRSNKPKRGRKRTPDSIAARLGRIEAELAAADALGALRLLQERRNLQAELGTMGSKVDISALEAEFVKVAKVYSDRQGISYATWRDVGVDASVLRSAGIGRAG
ncbi:MAG: hypothetical protein FD127_1063 [Acidimicrobiaceae bacterium]|nr:MAG: hypothetical protein FD127_1063 [Acidimicrobiaceae bacterium]